MRTPESLESAVDSGVIQEVVRPLMSGKEAQVYVVVVGGTECVAKVYKEASQRTFKHRAEYTEGRRTRNSRDQRAMGKRTRHGKSQDEAGWRNTEVDMIYRLNEAGVRVPEVINFIDGVLIMEFVKDADGDPAPRLGDLSFTASEARDVYRKLLRETTRMLCAGVIHGDLSEFNVLMGADGPVIIDFPQAMEAARNQGARKFLLRDVENLHRFVERYAPLEPTLCYGEEMWELYEANRLDPDTELRGDYQAPDDIADTSAVLALIEDAARDEEDRREARGEEPRQLAAPFQLRKVVDFSPAPRPKPSREASPQAPIQNASPGTPRETRPRQRPGGAPNKPSTSPGALSAGRSAGADTSATPRKPRNRRGRRKPSPTRDATAGGAAAGGASASPPPRNAAPPFETRAAGSGEALPSKRRRRGGRNRSRSDSAGAKASTPNSGERPAHAHQAPKPTATRPSSDADRPARRRRRKPRAPGSPA